MIKLENIFSYLKWRGDILFKAENFNEIDNLIFCALSYLKFDDCLNYQDIMTIEEINLCYKKKEESSNFYKESEQLLEKVAKSKRFQSVKIARYKRINDKKLEKQFGAMTFILPIKMLYVTFSGTDETIIGWKEDFNLSVLNPIPAQIEAKNYLEEICKSTNKKIIVGGHSKGGNLAMYASIFCPNIFKDKIMKVYNNDGPGLDKAIFSTTEYKFIKDKIVTYIPKFSIVGYLFYNETNIQLIESYSIGFLEHDLFTWKVDQTHFVIIKNLNSMTKSLIQNLNTYLEKMPLEKRKTIINTLFNIFSILHIESFSDLEGILPKLPKILKKQVGLFDYLDDILQILEIIIQIFRTL